VNGHPVLLVLAVDFDHVIFMSEISSFLNHGASLITSAKVDELLRQLPLLKAEFTQIDDTGFPHLVNQLNFLADYVEDFGEGKLSHATFHAVAAAAFTLIYAHRVVDLIPDTLGPQGHIDDSALARATIIVFEKQFRAYADSRGIDWQTITSQA
jgi:uncharacterized membrane protein YkvA (DUF1232 family)